MQLTEHFSWAEVIHSDTALRRNIDNSLPPDLFPNAQRTAEHMEQVRALLHSAIKVNSWYRCLMLNTAVGGARTSYHMKGLAVDFSPAAGSLNGAFEKLALSTIPFDQLIQEGTKDGAAWIHIGFAEMGKKPRRDVLTAWGNKLGGSMVFTRVTVS